MPEQLAYSYHAVFAILSERGYSEEEIGDFLKRHQNESGYITMDKLPK